MKIWKKDAYITETVNLVRDVLRMSETRYLLLKRTERRLKAHMGRRKMFTQKFQRSLKTESISKSFVGNTFQSGEQDLGGAFMLSGKVGQPIIARKNIFGLRTYEVQK